MPPLAPKASHTTTGIRRWPDECLTVGDLGNGNALVCMGNRINSGLGNASVGVDACESIRLSLDVGIEVPMGVDVCGSIRVNLNVDADSFSTCDVTCIGVDVRLCTDLFNNRTLAFANMREAYG